VPVAEAMLVVVSLLVAVPAFSLWLPGVLGF
jgi:hypothetical protein